MSLKETVKTKIPNTYIFFFFYFITGRSQTNKWPLLATSL